MKGREFDHSHYANWIDPNEVNPYERNAKKHDDIQIANIANSIHRFGWQQDTVLTKDNVLVIGHGRRLAALKLGCEMPYHVVDKTADELTDEYIRELRIVDNQTNAETGLDFDLLGLELADLDFDGFDFDFPSEIMDDEGRAWFEREQKDGAKHEEGNDEYNDFVDKFDAPKTTDDCYTPDIVYDAVADYVRDTYGVEKEKMCRPFYPGGDYQKFSYDGRTVVDNPPFSILAEIVDFYVDRKIPFFIFAPGLATLNYVNRENVCAVCTYAGVTYENGASVVTSFLTNLEDPDVFAIACPELYEKIDKANEENEKLLKKHVPKYEFPIEVLTAAKMGWLSKYGQKIVVKRSDAMSIRQLDAMKESGKGIYGNALLLSERAAAERAAAERAAATVWPLSDREKDIIRGLG